MNKKKTNKRNNNALKNLRYLAKKHPNKKDTLLTRYNILAAARQLDNRAMMKQFTMPRDPCIQGHCTCLM